MMVVLGAKVVGVGLKNRYKLDKIEPKPAYE
jgi:hypothetical protein